MELLHHEDDGYARCVGCGAPAVGPCARCETPLCGDCAIITTGGTKPYAICGSCDRARGRSLTGGWRTVIGFFLLPIAALAAVVYVLWRLVGP